MERRQECQRNRRVALFDQQGRIEGEKYSDWEAGEQRVSLSMERKRDWKIIIKVKDEEEKCKNKGGTCKAKEEEEKELLHT